MLQSFTRLFPCVLVAIVCLVSRSPAQEVAPDAFATPLIAPGDGPVRVVCLGDSVTGVYYHTGGRRAYPEMLELALKRIYPRRDVSVINAGISGNTTADGLKRLDADVIAHHPTLVTVMFGLNDLVRVPMTEYEANLVSIIQRCRDAGAAVLLCTPNAITGTDTRPTAALLGCIEVMARVGAQTGVPIADVYAACDAVRTKDRDAWVMMMSDEIHPSMTGHKLTAETIAQRATLQKVSLADEGPLEPAVPRLLRLLHEGKTIKLHAMPPYDRLFLECAAQLAPDAKFEVSTWPVEGLTLPQIEESAKSVRERKLDLVICAVPLSARADTRDEFVRAYKWTLNYALSFGHQEWDCIAIAPSFSGAPTDAEEQGLEQTAREIIRAQDLPLLARNPGDARSTGELLTDWLKDQLSRADLPTEAPTEEGTRATLKQFRALRPLPHALPSRSSARPVLRLS